jgi:hypothetical protein
LIEAILELKSSAKPSTRSLFRKAFSHTRLKALGRLLIMRGYADSEARLCL